MSAPETGIPADEHEVMILDDLGIEYFPPDFPPKKYTKLYAAWQWKLRVQRMVMAFCGVMLTVLVGIQVVTRYGFGFSFFGIEELAMFLSIWLYFVGGAYGAWERGHISASLVELIFKHGSARRVLNIIAGIITVILSAWMTVWAVQYTVWNIHRGTRSMELGIPLYWVHVAIPLGVGLMTLYFFIDLMTHIFLKQETHQ
jgi:TRAP-type C4-dicarboxylate transport system permease small subunit|tara:strand:+ start:537 stop:1136 length:600 start_codon:yes stop_codon:yes gene_type:complete